MSFGPNVRNGVGLGLGSIPSLKNAAPYAALNLRFTETTALDPRIAFSRASGGTYIDSTGSLAWANSNQLLYSEEFNQAGSWSVTSCSITANAATAPDGTLTADKLVENTAVTTTHFVAQNVTTQSFQYTFSVYAKAAGRNYALLFHAASGATQIFDLTTAQPVTTVATPPVAAYGELVGDGWCRISITINSTDASNGFRIYPALGPGSSSNWSYTGDGVSGIYLWGAQLNNDGVQPYNKTTTAAYYGPRFDYNPITLANRGFLVEPARTNSNRNSVGIGAVAGTPGTAPTNWTLHASGTNGITRSVVGTGTENGIQYVDVRFNGTPTTTFSLFTAFEANTQVPALVGQIWTHSVSMRQVAGSSPGSVHRVAIVERNSAGSAINFNQTAFFDVPSSGNLAINRFVITVTLPFATTAYAQAGVVHNVTTGVPVDFTIRYGLSQLEQGYGATSVIPTTTIALTRAADVALMSGTNFSSWYNQPQGTFVAEYDTVNLSGTSSVISLLAATTADRIVIGDNSAVRRAVFVVAGAAQFTSEGQIGSDTSGTVAKVAHAYASANYASVANGGTVYSQASGTVPTPIQMYVGASQTGTNQLTGHLRSLRYYPSRLPNATLQALTV